jgi:hypothetical protein
LRFQPWRGRSYDLRDRNRWKLIGWHPGKRENFFSDLTMRDGIRRTVSIYPPPSTPQIGPIRSLDRLVDHLPSDALTPQIHRVYFVSTLYRDRMRKLRIGGLDIRLVLIVLGILGVVLALLYFSGYLGG